MSLWRVFRSHWWYLIFRLHPDASVTDAAIPNDGASTAHGHHPLREHPRVRLCPTEHPQVRAADRWNTREKWPFFFKQFLINFLLSLPLGSQIISVPVNSSLSWHTNRLRDVSKDVYNVSYAWKLVNTCTVTRLRTLNYLIF